MDGRPEAGFRRNGGNTRKYRLFANWGIIRIPSNLSTWSATVSRIHENTTRKRIRGVSDLGKLWEQRVVNEAYTSSKKDKTRMVSETQKSGAPTAYEVEHAEWEGSAESNDMMISV